MQNEKKTDIGFPKSQAELGELITDLTEALRSVHSELEVVKQHGGGGGKWENFWKGLSVIVIPVLFVAFGWMWATEGRLNSLENMEIFTQSQALRMEQRIIEAVSDRIPASSTIQELADHEARIRALEDRR